MSESAYTIILHGNDATGKSTLVPALRAAGQVVYARGDEDVTLEDGLFVRGFDKLTLQLADDNRGPLPESYTDTAGTHRRIVRVILDADLPILQARLAKRPRTDQWESEKALFYFRARFLVCCTCITPFCHWRTLTGHQELAAFYGLPGVDTGRKSVDESVTEIIALARSPGLLKLFSTLALRTLTPEDVASLANRRMVLADVDYGKRLEEIIATECGSTSIFTAEDVRAQCSRDPGLVHALVNHYDNLHDANAPGPLRLRLVVEGESKQIYRVETDLTRHFDDHILIFLKPTIYSHSKQATGEITGLSAIRATGSRLFLEMLHRAGINHTYQGLNGHGLIWAHNTKTTQIESVYKEVCAGTDKYSYLGLAADPKVTLPRGQYKRGPYVRFDWRNPNYTYNGIDPATHPFYHLMEASVGKAVFYDKFLTARAKPMGDKCMPEELVHGVQAVEASVDSTMRVFFTIQHHLHRIGLEIEDGCIMLDPTGRTVWSEINQDCMRIKRREGKDAFDKDVWRAGGSSAKECILDQWTQLNTLLGEHLGGRPFHEHEMVSPGEAYGLHAQNVLNDKALSLTSRYAALYKRFATRDRIRSTRLPRAPADEEGACERLSHTDTHTETDTGAAFARLDAAAPDAVEAEADDLLARVITPPGTMAVGVTANKYADKTDQFTLTQFGIRLIRPEGRCLRLEYELVDAAKFTKAFGEGVSVHFVPTKPKDMPGLLARGTLDAAVTYSSVMDNFPTVARLVASVPDPDISLALIARRSQQIDPSAWTADKPARIAAEHVRMVQAYLSSLDLEPDTYEIHRVLGSSESYLVNDPHETYLLCDAIVSTGTTLQANNLDVWRVVKDRGDIRVGLYQRG